MAYPRTHILPRSRRELAGLVGGVIGCIVFGGIILIGIHVIGTVIHRPGIMLWGL